MRLYQMIFGVPDDFESNKLSMNVTYETDDDIDLLSEGFIGPDCIWGYDRNLADGADLATVIETNAEVSE